MDTDILAVTARLRSAIKASGGNQVVARVADVPKGTINNTLRGARTSFATFARIARACNVSLDWIATGQEAAALKYFADDEIEILAWKVAGGDSHQQICDLLKEDLGQPELLDPMFRAVVADQHAVANTGDRAVVQPQAATARTDDIETHYVLTLPPDMQRALLRSISEMALSEEDEKVGPFIRGFIRAATFAEGR